MRSIPAYAGEPFGMPLTGQNLVVYPRVCGGTAGKPRGVPVDKGLSPRMRGNLVISAPPSGRGGSIPAYAGEPGH